MTICVCATHGHCFDGLASAALFTELYARLNPEATLRYVACGYGAGQTGPTLDGDDNVILDYRYQSSPALSFYIDHHPTAFRDSEERQNFEARADTAPDRFIWDPSSVSCTGVVARVAKERYGVDLTHHQELVTWADRIDGAQFPSAEEATNRDDARMRLVSVVERFGDNRFLEKAVPILRDEGLSALGSARFVKDHYRSIAPQFREYEKRVRERGRHEGRVAFIDLTESIVTLVSKFSQYRSFPHALYSVLVTRMPGGVKISVGFNPWSGQERDVNIGKLCAAHGGGGHQVVGAISFPPDQTSRALELACAIAAQLQSPSSSLERAALC